MLDSKTPQSVETTAGSSSVSASLPKRWRKIAIIGFGGTAKDTPVADTSWELWGMNGFWRAAEPDYKLQIPEDRWSLWFDMHSAEYLAAYGVAAGIEDKQQQWLAQEHPFPILMLEENPAWPSVQAFPIERVVGLLGRDYFTSTVAYCLAFALAQPDVAEIGLWGVDLVHSTEYSDQRPCAEYWIGRAESSGLKVTIHEQSALLRQRHRYGYENADPLVADLRAFLQAQTNSTFKAIEDGKAQIEQLQGQMHTNDGAYQMAKCILERIDVYARGGRILG